MNTDDHPADPQQLAAEQPAPSPEAVAPWEQIEPGRFMPRRVRGSCVGMPLG